MGGRLHLKLNMGERPIANKYREGKMKRTLKRELKVREIAKRQGIAFFDMAGLRAACVFSEYLLVRCGQPWVNIDFYGGKWHARR